MLNQVVVSDIGIIIKEDVGFLESDSDKYIGEFENLKRKGIIADRCNFFDSVWIYKSGEFNHNYHFRLNEVWFKKYEKSRKLGFSYKIFDLALRRFSVNAILYYSPFTLKGFIKKLKALIDLTNFFDINEVGKLQSNIAINNVSIITLIEDFFDFFQQFEFPYAYREAFDSILDSKVGYTCRQLPSFESSFDFNDIMKDFKINSKNEELLRFFPIILWWEITSLIPLRTTEFLMTPFDCIFEKDSKYYLTVRRSLLKGYSINSNKEVNHDISELYSDDIIEISKECYDLIKQYKDFTDIDYDNRNLLISKKSYNQLKGGVGAATINGDVFTYNNLAFLLGCFYSDIVEGKYNRVVIPKGSTEKYSNKVSGRTMEKIQLYDTRHLAIINLIFMGNEAETTMRLAGHKKMETTVGYYDHYEEYVRGYSISYAKTLFYKKQSSRDVLLSMEDVNIVSKALSNWGKVSGKKETLHDVDGGYCTYHLQDYIPCLRVEGVHSKCQYFISNDDGLKEEISLITQDISSEIETLRYLVKNSKEISNYSELRKTASEKIIRLSNSKAQMLSNLKTINEIENFK